MSQSHRVTTIHSTSIYNDISGVSNPMCVHVLCFSYVQLFVTPWTIACQTLLSMGFSRQEYWSRLLWPPPGDLSNPGIEPSSPTLAGGFLTTNATWEAQVISLDTIRIKATSEIPSPPRVYQLIEEMICINNSIISRM